MKKPLIIIGGPTACGKTAMSILLAKKIGEIISADSMQVYRYMDIGTAKVTKEEADGVPHYLIDEFDPDEEYNVMIFQQKAKAYMEEIWAKGKIPIVVGGTGFYCSTTMLLQKQMVTIVSVRHATNRRKWKDRKCFFRNFWKLTRNTLQRPTRIM